MSEFGQSSEYIPHNLRMTVKRMDNYRQNNLKLQVQSQTEAAAGSKIVVNLPSQGMINLDSLTMCGKVVAVSHDVQLPQSGIGGLIQRVDVSVGGAIIDSIQNYNLLFNTVKKWTTSNPANRQSAMALTTGAVGAGTADGAVGTDLAASYGSGDYNGTYSAAVAGGALEQEIQNGLGKPQRWLRNVSLAAATNSASFNYSSWLGLLGKDLYLQLDTLPSPVQITITLDDSSCTTSTNAAGTYKLTDLHFRVQSVEFPLLSRSVYAMLQRNQPVPIPFTRWVNFSFSHGAGSAVVNDRWSVASQCISRVWTVNNQTVNMNHDTRSAALQDAGYDVEKFISCADGMTNYYLEVDNRRTSQYDFALADNAYATVLEAMGVNSDTSYDNCIDAMGAPAAAASINGGYATYGSNNFYGSSWLALFNLAFNAYDRDGHDSISGVNSMGLSAALSYNARTGAAQASTQNYFVETKAILNILPNRVVETVY